MEWRKEDRITITHLAKDDGEDDDLFWVCYISSRLFHIFKRENNNNKKVERQNRQGWRNGSTISYKNHRPHLSALALSLYLGACQLSVYCWPGR